MCIRDRYQRRVRGNIVREVVKQVSIQRNSFIQTWPVYVSFTGVSVLGLWFFTRPEVRTGESTKKSRYAYRWKLIREGKDICDKKNWKEYYRNNGITNPFGH
eukprot:TRINITY_DN545_c0_g1_i1.p1 TRINITY_DN545_c0_g1~~TRINITY_DN545_c0_g1_i1.p1  ORF type:complete len:102 (+),score=17.21 TRINITY_DN545_c0_g1_i1:3-308(+)